MTDHELQQDINLALADDEQTLWGSRLVKKSLFDADGSTLGSIQDILLVQAASENKLYLRGFIASVDRRLIFVHEARVDAVDRDGLHLRGGTLDLRIFKNATLLNIFAADPLDRAFGWYANFQMVRMLRTTFK